MKTISGLSLLALTATAQAGGLYQIPDSVDEPSPLTWIAGLDFVYDDNTTPTAQNDDESISVNPYVQLQYSGVVPQTTIDLYARVGLIYYFDDLDAANTDDTYTQARAGLDVTHRFNERLNLISRNFISYELEPNYSYGFATSRQSNEFLYINTDNTLGYRWTERFATYQSIAYDYLDFEGASNADRQTLTASVQSRYQLSLQTVVTGSYRYADTTADGVARDSSSHFFLVGVEHSINPNSVVVANVGVQHRSVDGAGASDETSPYLEVSLNSRINQQFALKGYLRYGIEVTDTVQTVGAALAEFDDRRSLRLGVSGEYEFSSRLKAFAGIDLIHTEFNSGRAVVAPFGSVGDLDEFLINAHIGASVQITDYLTGSLTYNFTNSDSDIVANDFDRNRITVGLRAEF